MARRFSTWLLPAALALLMIDAIIELSFVSSMVAWLHRTAGGDFEVIATATPDTMSFLLHGKPKGLLVNQGHTSNAAAGTAFVLVGLGGILVLSIRHYATHNRKAAKSTTALYYAWLVSTILSALLTLAALIYTFVLTNDHKSQSIDMDTAVSLDNRPYPNFVPYPLEQWTPENWFGAVLELQLVHEGQRDDIARHLTIMRAWRWNLVPLFILGLGLCAVAILDAWQRRRNEDNSTRQKFEPVRGTDE